ncbi:hypothetical protein DIPPA_25739 [Diplonema papillatum]|nr:hypothetical protein DIPPA_25739 [Diplonema papillatum]
MLRRTAWGLAPGMPWVHPYELGISRDQDVRAMLEERYTNADWRRRGQEQSVEDESYRVRKLREDWKAVETMGRTEIGPEAVGALLRVHAQRGDLNSAEKALARFKSDGFTPTEFEYTSFVNSYVRANNLDRAFELLRESNCRSTRMYNGLLPGVLKATGGWPWQEVLRRMDEVFASVDLCAASAELQRGIRECATYSFAGPADYVSERRRGNPEEPDTAGKTESTQPRTRSGPSGTGVHSQSPGGSKDAAGRLPEGTGRGQPAPETLGLTEPPPTCPGQGDSGLHSRSSNCAPGGQLPEGDSQMLASDRPAVSGELDTDDKPVSVEAVLSKSTDSAERHVATSKTHDEAAGQARSLRRDSFTYYHVLKWGRLSTEADLAAVVSDMAALGVPCQDMHTTAALTSLAKWEDPNVELAERIFASNVAAGVGGAAPAGDAAEACLRIAKRPLAEREAAEACIKANGLLVVYRNAGRWERVRLLFGALRDSETADDIAFSVFVSTVARMLELQCDDVATDDTDPKVTPASAGLLKEAQAAFRCARERGRDVNANLWAEMMHCYAALRLKGPAVSLMKALLLSSARDTHLARRHLARACAGDVPRDIPPHLDRRRQTDYRKRHAAAASERAARRPAPAPRPARPPPPRKPEPKPAAIQESPRKPEPKPAPMPEWRPEALLTKDFRRVLELLDSP